MNKQYERLFQLVRLGDEEAALALISEAERRGDMASCERAISELADTRAARWVKARKRLRALRAILRDGASHGAWRALSRLLQAWPEREGFRVGLLLAENHLKAWPRSIRCANAGWWYRRLEGRCRPELWRLARVLDLNGIRLTAHGAERLVGGVDLEHFHGLVVGSCRLGDAGVGVLSRSRRLFRVVELDVSNNQLSLLGARELARSPYLINVRRLDVSCNAGLGDAGLAELARSGHGDTLTHLRACSSHVGQEGAAALMDACDGLVRLALSCNLLGDKGVVCIAQSPRAASLESLELSSNGVGVAGVRALSESPHLGRLRVLDLRDNPLGEEALEALASAQSLRRLERLELTLSGVSHRRARKLLQSGKLPRLSELHLGPRQRLQTTQSEGLGSALAVALSEHLRLQSGQG